MLRNIYPHRMEVAVVSDIHDHIQNLEKSIYLIKKMKCGAVIFCGDMNTSFTAERLDKAGIKIYAVLGNAESDAWGDGALLRNFDMFPPEQEFGEVEMFGRKIAFSHYPKVAKELLSIGYYDAVFFGHTHKVFIEKRDGKILANPGAVCGLVNGKKGIASFLVYDTLNNLLKLQKID